MADSPPATSFRTFEEDVGGGRSIALLRLVGAGVLLACSAWLVITTPVPRALAIAAIALLVAGGWIAGYVRSRRPARRVSLTLSARGIDLVTSDRVEHVAWRDVARVSVDEDRLVVRIERRAGEPLILEPVFRGVGVYALEEAVTAAQREATGGADAAHPNG